MEFVHQPSPSNRLGDYLKDNLSLSGQWTHFRAAVAFVKRSGTKHITTALTSFAQAGHIEIVAGVDHRGTSAEGLRDLLEAVSPNGQVIVFHNRLPLTFHPKVYLFRSPLAADIVIGSGNLTEGGLFTNYEAALRLSLNLNDPDQATMLRSIEQVLDTWADLFAGTARVLDTSLLGQLTAAGLVPLDVSMAQESANVEQVNERTRSGRERSLFAARSEHRAPPVPRPASTLRPPTEFGAVGFIMTLQRTDVGVGQATAGASRRSPEIFIPLAARNANPDFWGWPGAFTPDPQRPDKLDRSGVRMRLGGEVVTVNMMTWPVKHDFRLRCEALRSAGNVGDILRMERVKPSAGYEYYVEVIPEGTSQHPAYLALCRNPVRNSRKRYGYYY